MPDKKQSPQQQVKLEKKLRRRERRLQERLQEAQQAHAKAAERLKRAESRVQKRQLRMQRVTNRLALIHQQLQKLRALPEQQSAAFQVGEGITVANVVGASPTSPAAPMPEALTSIAETPAATTDADQALQSPQDLQAAAATHETSSTPDAEGVQSSQSALTFAEATGLAKIARAFAEATEWAARIAMERAAEVAARLERMSSGRHLMQELIHTQSEAEYAQQVAEEAARAAQEAERRAMHASTQDQTTGDESLTGKTQAESLALRPGDEQQTADEEAATPQAAESKEMSQVDSPSASEEVLAPLEEIEEIEEEEEVVSAAAAMLIADVAAAAAAEAEALAEASSARTREARFQALQAEQVLEEVRTAINSGVLSGEDAEISLQDAEGNATLAHALLVDAEAAEERARNAAMNAEAEAEVAEGMAFAADELAGLSEEEIAIPAMGEANGYAQSSASSESDVPDGEDITMEMPIVRPQETE